MYGSPIISKRIILKKIKYKKRKSREPVQVQDLAFKVTENPVLVNHRMQLVQS